MISIVISALLLQTTASASNLNALPDIGDSAITVLTPEKERLLGQQIMSQLRPRTDFSDDAITLTYLYRLTQHLAQFSPRPIMEPHIYVVRNPTINAFALPGNHFAFHTGLITAADNEAALASVIAHELAHQSQRHIPRMLERAKARTLPATAGLLAGLLIGGQVGLATITSVSAASISDQLAYNRHFEKEADATGIEILAAAGYPPTAMTQFFSELESQARIAGSQAPEFLRTHPLSVNRVAASRAKASSLSPADRRSPTTPLEFALIQARTQALQGQDKMHLAQQFSDDQKSLRRLHQLRGVYGASVLQLTQGRLDNPNTVIQKLDAAKTLLTDEDVAGRTLIDLLIAEVQISAQQFSSAQHRLQSLLKQSPASYVMAANLSLANSYRLDQQPDKAAKLLRTQLRDSAYSPWVYPALIRATGEDGRMTEAALLRAEYALELGDPVQAEVALTGFDQIKPVPSDYHQARARHLLSQATQLKSARDAFEL